MSKIKNNKKNKVILIVVGIVVVAAIIAVGIIVGVKYSPSNSNTSIDYSYNADASYNLKIKLKDSTRTTDSYNEIIEKVESAVENDSANTAQKKISAGITYLCNDYDITLVGEDTEQALYYSYYIKTYIETNEDDYLDNETIGKAYELADDAFTVSQCTFQYLDYSVLHQSLFNEAVKDIVG